MRKFIPVVAVALLSACASIDIAKTQIAVATHNDILGAAKVYTDAGYPAVAAVFTAWDVQLTACENAISSSLPKPPAPTTNAGPLTALASLDVAAGRRIRIPDTVRLNCKVPVIILPVVPLP